LHANGAPEGTRELALICDDPDAPVPQPWVHWVLYKIPADRTSLGEGDNGGGEEGITGWGEPGYRGPMPPPGHGVHRYFFKLYALDQPVNLAPGASKEELLAAIEGHTLAEAELIGTYERK
jgi:Raf kinase inhibitor-like YbhB/YbcL family protein